MPPLALAAAREWRESAEDALRISELELSLCKWQRRLADMERRRVDSGVHSELAPLQTVPLQTVPLQTVPMETAAADDLPVACTTAQGVARPRDLPEACMTAQGAQKQEKICFLSLPKCRTPTFAICPKVNSQKQGVATPRSHHRPSIQRHTAAAPMAPSSLSSSRERHEGFHGGQEGCQGGPEGCRDWRGAVQGRHERSPIRQEGSNSRQRATLNGRCIPSRVPTAQSLTARFNSRALEDAVQARNTSRAQPHAFPLKPHPVFPRSRTPPRFPPEAAPHLIPFTHPTPI